MQSRPGHLFYDARGHPAHLGAVLIIDGRCCFTEYAPPGQLMSQFRRRRDNQIMGLELLSISLGLCTLEALIVGRNIIIHSDNTGSGVCVDESLHVIAWCGTFFAVRGSGGDPQGDCGVHGSRAVSPHTVDADRRAGASRAHYEGFNRRQHSGSPIQRGIHLQLALGVGRRVAPHACVRN